jgi:hypothetical protein
MSEMESPVVLKRAKWAVGGIVGILVLGAVIVFVLRSFQAHALERSTALHARQ